MQDQDKNTTQRTAPAVPEAEPHAEPAAEPPRQHQKLIWALVISALLLAGAAVAFFALTNTLKEETPTAQTPGDSSSQRQNQTFRVTVAEKGKLVLPNGHADPTVLPTADGYRMYVNRQSGGRSGILTYTSTDGVTWQKEQDIIIPGASTSRAVKMDGGVRLYYPGPQPINESETQEGMFSSFSMDGKSFTKDLGVAVKPRSGGHYVEGPTVFQLADKTWRMYFNENTVAAGNNRDGEIWGASSTDGKTWTRDSTVTLTAEAGEEASTTGQPAPWKQVLHPFVLKNPKGGYIMFYNSHSEIYAATSTDGKKWEKTGKIGVHGADIDGFFQADGTIRVYYGDFTEQTGGLVYSAVLKVER